MTKKFDSYVQKLAGRIIMQEREKPTVLKGTQSVLFTY